MNKKITDYFKDNKIEYFAALDYKEQREINPHLRERLDFDARSVIIYLVPYYAGACGNLSLYAGSLDYHIILSELGDGLVNLIKTEYNGANAARFGDRSPIDERYTAVTGGLGILGKNGLVINERYGSYVFIGEVLTDIPPEVLGVKKLLSPSYCKGCGACLSACPTGALSGCGECLSAITQKKGELSESDAELIVRCNTVWGCDACQTACPYNNEPRFTPIDFFYKDRILHLNSEALSGFSKQEFAKRAFSWRGRATVQRNIEIYEAQKK